MRGRLVPHRRKPSRHGAAGKLLGDHAADRRPVLVAVVMDDQRGRERIHIEPPGDRGRADAVVRPEAHERLPVQSRERRDRGDLEQTRLTQDRGTRQHLGRMEVADVGEHVFVGRSRVRVRGRLGVPVGSERFECLELDGAAALRVSQLHAQEDFAARGCGRPRERQACIDATHVAAPATRRLE